MLTCTSHNCSTRTSTQRCIHKYKRNEVQKPIIRTTAHRAYRSRTHHHVVCSTYSIETDRTEERAKDEATIIARRYLHRVRIYSSFFNQTKNDHIHMCAVYTRFWAYKQSQAALKPHIRYICTKRTVVIHQQDAGHLTHTTQQQRHESALILQQASGGNAPDPIQKHRPIGELLRLLLQQKQATQAHLYKWFI